MNRRHIGIRPRWLNGCADQVDAGIVAQQING